MWAAHRDEILREWTGAEPPWAATLFDPAEANAEIPHNAERDAK
jgi:hypothetical protein